MQRFKFVRKLLGTAPKVASFLLLDISKKIRCADACLQARGGIHRGTGTHVHGLSEHSNRLTPGNSPSTQ